MHCVSFLFSSVRCYGVSTRCCITPLLSSVCFNRHNTFTGFKPLVACESPYILQPSNTPSNYPQGLQCAAFTRQSGVLLKIV